MPLSPFSIPLRMDIPGATGGVTVRSLTVLVVLALSGGCALTTHPTVRSSLGVPRSPAEPWFAIDVPGPVTVETVVAADWKVPRGGLVNLDHPAAQAAGLRDDLEPIQVYFHALRHPTRGLFIVDTGVERAMRDRPGDAAVRGVVASRMKLETMAIRTPLADWLAAQAEPLGGVFLTHLHPDHVTGMADVAPGTPIYVGPGEASSRALVNVVLQANLDRALAGKAPLAEWPFAPDASGRFAGVLDVFGDGSVWALWVPGHTPGSTAYLVRTPSGPVLLTGDACHTRWGWEHDVEPGSFSSDLPRSASSLAALRRLAADHPGMEVRFGHQR
jgi:glyoxylase-like metal-dependent hydrolase (beta-lactamase superfamily II)